MQKAWVIGLSVIITGTGVTATAQEITTKCEQRGNKTKCVTTPDQPRSRLRFDQPDPGVSEILRSMDNMNVKDPSEGVARRRMEEERLDAIKRENALRQQQINTSAAQGASIQRIFAQVERIEAQCQAQYDSRQIKTYYAKTDCAAQQVLPLVARGDVPIDDIMKGAYARAKIIARKADQKKITVEEMEAQEADLEGETMERLHQRMSMMQ